MFRANKSKIIRLVLNNQFSVFGNVTLASHFHCCFKLQIKTKGRSFVLKTKGEWPDVDELTFIMFHNADFQLVTNGVEDEIAAG